MTVEDVGSKAIGGLVSGLQGLSMAAFWKKDGDALKEFGKMLGKMLIQLGTMAVAYAGVAALGTVFPVLQGVVGPAAGAPALAAVGAGAIAAGALLGAAIPRGAGGGSQPSGGGDGGRPVETSRTTVYNLNARRWDVTTRHESRTSRASKLGSRTGRIDGDELPKSPGLLVEADDHGDRRRR